MKFKLYADVREFYNDTFGILSQNEPQNMIILGNLIIGNEGKDKTGWRDTANWLMAAVSDENGIVLTALMTPPMYITLYPTDNIIYPEAVKCLVNGLNGCSIPGVVTESSLSRLFAEEYSAYNGLTYKTTMSQRIYQLTEVNKDIKRIGKIRLLKEDDMHFFPYWLEAFGAANVYGSTNMSIPQDYETYLYRVRSEKMYILEVDGKPVSMAGYTRVMNTAVGVAFVYTPPYFRGKGYASSCVAQLSEKALADGFSKCVLYTDLLNPTSNDIYAKIGYKPVCDSLMLGFCAKEDK